MDDLITMSYSLVLHPDRLDTATRSGRRLPSGGARVWPILPASSHPGTLLER
jgi:hypothetical protein